MQESVVELLGRSREDEMIGQVQTLLEVGGRPRKGVADEARQAFKNLLDKTPIRAVTALLLIVAAGDYSERKDGELEKLAMGFWFDDPASLFDDGNRAKFALWAMHYLRDHAGIQIAA